MAFDLVTVSDRRHSTLQKGFNLRWPLGNVQGQSSPNGANLIYLCRSPQDIMDAAAQALALPNGRITVRSGGHCYEGFVANKMPDSPNEVLSILDISALNRVIYDANGQIGSELNPTQPFRYRFRLEAGGQNWDTMALCTSWPTKPCPAAHAIAWAWADTFAVAAMGCCLASMDWCVTGSAGSISWCLTAKAKG